MKKRVITNTPEESKEIRKEILSLIDEILKNNQIRILELSKENKQLKIIKETYKI